MPVKRVRLLPQAERDLDEETLYIAGEGSVEAGIGFFNAAHTTFEDLLAIPGIGKIRNVSTARLAGLRKWRVSGYERYLIFYRPAPGGIDIVRVLHGARDIDPILEESGFE